MNAPAPSRPAFYALRNGGWRDYLTLLHPPYTVWHLSYVVLGASLAPRLNLNHLAWTVLAFFLAVGIAAHALDELRGRPLGSRIPKTVLTLLAAISLSAALGVGIYAGLVINLWVYPFMAVGAFLVLAYNLEWWHARFHSNLWFALAWGAFPALASYWSQAERIDATALLLAAACLLLTLLQRLLSTEARRLRRNLRAVSGTLDFGAGPEEQLTQAKLLALPERALLLLSLAVPLLALAALMARLI